MSMIELVKPSDALVTKEAKDRRDFQLQCIENIDRAYIDLGLSCLETKSKQEYIQWGYSSIEEYVGNELMYKPSTVRYFMQIARMRIDLGDTVEDADWMALGPTKQRVLASSRPDKDEIPALVEKYKDKKISYRDMAKELSDGNPDRKAKADDSRIKMSLMFFKDQWLIVHEALEKAREEHEDADASDARMFEMICADYLAGPTARIVKQGSDNPYESISDSLKELGLHEDSAEMIMETIRTVVNSKAKKPK